MKLKNIRESFGYTYHDGAPEHCRLIEGINGPYPCLEATRHSRGGVKLTRRIVGHDADSLRPLVEMPCGFSTDPVGIHEAFAHSLHVEASEMEKIQIGTNVEIMPLHPVEATPPPHGTGYDGPLGVACAQISVAALLQEFDLRIDLLLFLKVLANVDTERRGSSR